MFIILKKNLEACFAWLKNCGINLCSLSAIAPHQRPIKIKLDIIIYVPHFLHLGNKTLSLKTAQAIKLNN